MSSIPIKVWNRIDMLQQPIAAEITEVNSIRRRWVSIHYDINRKSLVAYPQHLYCVIDTEFDTELLRKHTPDGDEDLAIISNTKYYANDIAQVYEILFDLKVDPASFDAPWHVNHPLL